MKVSIPSKVSAPITSGMEAIVEVDAYPADDFGGIIAEVFTILPTVLLIMHLALIAELILQK